MDVMKEKDSWIKLLVFWIMRKFGYELVFAWWAPGLERHPHPEWRRI